jgi:hypothetical protein
MTNNLNFADYILPLIVGRPEGDRRLSLSRYAGVAFYLGTGGLVATCKHVVQECGVDEVLLSKNLATGSFEPVTNVKAHPTYDFAVAQVGPPIQNAHLPLCPTPVVLGTEVQALGFTSRGQSGKDLLVESRLFKGYISRLSSTPSLPNSRTTLEVSFPSLKGFSGAPVISGPKREVIGMLFSNHESTIEQFKYSEVRDEQQTFTESIHRVLEFGLAHSTSDMQTFLMDLGVRV